MHDIGDWGIMLATWCYYLSRAGPSPTSDPVKPVLGLSSCPVFLLSCCPVVLLSGLFSSIGPVNSLPDQMLIRIPTQIAVDCKSVHYNPINLFFIVFVAAISFFYWCLRGPWAGSGSGNCIVTGLTWNTQSCNYFPCHPITCKRNKTFRPDHLLTLAASSWLLYSNEQHFQRFYVIGQFSRRLS